MGDNEMRTDEGKKLQAVIDEMKAAPLSIFAAIPKVMGEIGAVTKSRKNPQQGYSFRGIDDMYNAVQPAMVKFGVFCVPTVLEEKREERPSKNGGTLFWTILKVRHTFFASDGSHLDCVTIGEAMDSGDKSTNKAMSAAMKYALIEVFAIPTEEPKDTENDSPEPAPKPAAPKTPAPPPSQPKKPPVDLEALRKSLGERMARCKSMHEFLATIKNDIPEALKKEMAPTYYMMVERLAGEGDKDAEHDVAMREAKKNGKEAA